MSKTPPRKASAPNAPITRLPTATLDNLQENGWMCNCNPRALALVLTATTTRNPGKKFYTCPKGRDGFPCDFFIWVTEAQAAEALKDYTFNESKVRSFRGAATTPKRLRQTLLPGAPPPSRNTGTPSGRTRSGACYTRAATAPVIPLKALAPPSPPSRVKRRCESSPPSNEVSEQKPGPCKLRRPNRVTKNPHSTNNSSRASTPKPPPSSTSSRKAVAVTPGAWEHRSIAQPPSETDADEYGSDNNATVTPSLSPAPSPRRRLFNSNGEPTTPPRRAADMRTTPWTPRSRTGSFFSGALSSPGRGVQFDVRVAVSDFIRTEGINLKGAGGKLWDILEREVGQKEGVCQGREIARLAHQRATDVIAGLHREIAGLKKERDEALAANVKPKVAIEELETRLNNADLESLRATND